MNLKKQLCLLAMVLLTSGLAPTTGLAQNGDSKWYNPMTWSAPSMPWSKEPPRIKRKSQGVVSDFNRTAQKSWTKTKDAVNPTKLFVSGDSQKSKPKPKAKSESLGFWSGMFAPKESPREIRTVSDFLDLPPVD